MRPFSRSPESRRDIFLNIYADYAGARGQEAAHAAPDAAAENITSSSRPAGPWGPEGGYRRLRTGENVWAIRFSAAALDRRRRAAAATDDLGSPCPVLWAAGLAPPRPALRPIRPRLDGSGCGAPVPPPAATFAPRRHICRPAVLERQARSNRTSRRRRFCDAFSIFPAG